jgi:arsenate reductase
MLSEMHHLREGKGVAGCPRDPVRAKRYQVGSPTLEELRGWYRASGVPLKRFFNTSGLLYKSLDLKSKLPAMDEAEMLALLATDGMLVRRPILVGDDFVLVGFKETDWADRMSQ